MKKVIVASILGMALSAASSYGQGYIVMQNYDVVSGNALYSGVKYAAGQGAKSGEYVGATSGIEVELFYSATGGAGTFSLVPNSLTPFYTGIAGPSNDGGSPTTDGAGSFFGNTLTISSYSGGNAFFFVQAVNGGVVPSQSASAVFSMSLPTNSGLPAPDLLNLSGSTIQGLPAFTVVVPEPSILALSGIGAAALMLVRRKK